MVNIVQKKINMIVNYKVDVWQIRAIVYTVSKTLTNIQWLNHVLVGQAINKYA